MLKSPSGARLVREYGYMITGHGMYWVDHKTHVKIQDGAIYKLKIKDKTIYISKNWFKENRLQRK